MNAGTVLVAPYNVATAICGLTAGLLPPREGCAWHPAQLLRLKRGPRPASGAPGCVPLTELVEPKRPAPSMKAVNSLVVRFGKPRPAAGGPGRGPGSV